MLHHGIKSHLYTSYVTAQGRRGSRSERERMDLYTAKLRPAKIIQPPFQKRSNKIKTAKIYKSKREKKLT